MSKMDFSKLIILCGFLYFCHSTNALKIRQNADMLLYKNITTLNNALERIGKDMPRLNLTVYQNVISYILAEPLTDPLFEDEDLFNIAKFLSYFYEKSIYMELDFEETNMLRHTLNTLPTSYVNAVMLFKPCMRTKLYRGEYMMVIADDLNHVVRVVTLNPDYRKVLKRSIFWQFVNFKDKSNTENIVGISNDAFQEHYHSSYIFNDYKEDSVKNEALLFIGLQTPRPAYTSWKLHPKNNAFLIEDIITGQYICPGVSEILIWKYRFAYVLDKDYESFNEERCSWEVHNCDYERDPA